MRIIPMFIFTLLITLTIPVHAQIKKSKTWDICVHGGLMNPNTDLSGKVNISNIGYGFSVTKFIFPFFAIQNQLLIGNLKGGEGGTGSISKYRFETEIKYSASIHALFQVGNVGFLKNVPNLTFHVSGGVGIINFSPSVFSDDFSMARNYYVQNNLYDSLVDYRKTTELTFPVAAGMKYRVSKRFSFHLEYSMRFINTDKLDGWYVFNSGKDRFSYSNFGMTVHIGRIVKPENEVNRQM